jgi:hypothetical protein
MADENPLRQYYDLEYQDNPEVQRNLLVEAAVSRGLPPNFLVHLQQLETPNSKQPRTEVGRTPLPGGGRAKGILQFTPKMVHTYDIDPFSVSQSAWAAADMADKNRQMLRRRFPNLDEDTLNHYTAVAHFSGYGNMSRAGGIPSTPLAQRYSNKLRHMQMIEEQRLRDEISPPPPPPPAPPVKAAPPKPRGAAVQPMKKGSADIYDIRQMFGSTGEYVPGVDAFSRG